MEEKPILFSDTMVQAIRLGRKRVTRRVIKEDWLKQHNIKIDTLEGQTKALELCRFGKAGGELWVKECFSRDHQHFYPNYPLVYRADGYDPRENGKGSKVFSPEQNAEYRFRWMPSIFMKREYSRIQLNITNIRIERLHQMNEEEALLEGFVPLPIASGGHEPSALTEFRRLWEELNGAAKRSYGWRVNPWVFRVAFDPLRLNK